MLQSRMALAFLAIPLLIAVSWHPGNESKEPGEHPGSAVVEVEVDGRSVCISGPYTHEKLSVFLLHGQDQDDREYLTLHEGLETKVVEVTEKEQEQVGELLIENRSEQYLFLQEGDRLQGGKQDRTIISSLIVPPKSGKISVPTYCIEQSRWKKGSLDANFDVTKNAIFAPKDVRFAAKTSPQRSGQHKVWESVQKTKSQANVLLMADFNNSSLNETLDSPKVEQIAFKHADALKGEIEKYKDAIGIAIVVNGTIEEVNIYPNHRLLAKLSPRLIQSYAVQVALDRGSKSAREVSAASIARFMHESKEKNNRREEKTLNSANVLRIQEQSGQFKCATVYEGQTVHRQWLNGQTGVLRHSGSHGEEIIQTGVVSSPQLVDGEVRQTGVISSPQLVDGEVRQTGVISEPRQTGVISQPQPPRQTGVIPLPPPPPNPRPR